MEKGAAEGTSPTLGARAARAWQGLSLEGEEPLHMQYVSQARAVSTGLG